MGEQSSGMPAERIAAVNRWVRSAFNRIFDDSFVL
jgi:hypothetical protein